jgi:hypothetical protein
LLNPIFIKLIKQFLWKKIIELFINSVYQ